MWGCRKFKTGVYGPPREFLLHSGTEQVWHQKSLINWIEDTKSIILKQISLKECKTGVIYHLQTN